MKLPLVAALLALADARTVTTIAGSGGADGGIGLAKALPCSRDPGSENDGPALLAKFAAPTRVQAVGDTVYVADGENGCIRAIRAGNVSSLTPCCTDEIATGKGGTGPQDLLVADDTIWLLDSYHNQLKRSANPFDGWTVLAGNGSRPRKGRSDDGPATARALNNPHGFAVTSGGDVYIADTFSSCVRLLRDGQLTTIAGECGTGGHADGAPLDARFQVSTVVSLAVCQLIGRTSR